MSEWVDPKDRLPKEGEHVDAEYACDPPEVYRRLYWEAISGCDPFFEVVEDGFLMTAADVLRWRPVAEPPK